MMPATTPVLSVTMPKLPLLPIIIAALIAVSVSCSRSAAGEMHELASSGSVAGMEAILAERPFLVNGPDLRGRTPLHCACLTGQLDAARLLISHGAIVNARMKDGTSPLHIVAELGFVQVVNLLLENGADVNTVSTHRRTPLSVARGAGQSAVVDILIAHGAEDRGAPIATGTTSVRHFRKTVRGCLVDAVYANMNNPGVKLTTAIPGSGVGSLESFGSFVRRLRPTAAINGTFFSRASKLPIGDIVIDGNLAYAGGMGTAMCITADNKVYFRTPPRWVPQDWSGFDTVICCGPKLVVDSTVVVNPRAEGFKDPHVLGTARRTAVGITYMNRMLLLTTRKAVTLTKLAYIMKALGCTDAINFDGGSSSAMYYRGQALTRPSSGLANVLVVYE
jgi:hypothetical protein